MTVSDSNTDIHNDLIDGASSELYQYRGKITGVTVTGGQVSISSSEVGDTELAALALLPANSLLIYGVAVAGVAGFAGLTGLSHMFVSDSAANVQADIAFGGAHVLETNYAKIASIAATERHGDAGGQRRQRGAECPGAADHLQHAGGQRRAGGRCHRHRRPAARCPT